MEMTEESESVDFKINQWRISILNTEEKNTEK